MLKSFLGVKVNGSWQKTFLKMIESFLWVKGKGKLKESFLEVKGKGNLKENLSEDARKSLHCSTPDVGFLSYNPWISTNCLNQRTFSTYMYVNFHPFGFYYFYIWAIQHFYLMHSIFWLNSVILAWSPAFEEYSIQRQDKLHVGWWLYVLHNMQAK